MAPQLTSVPELARAWLFALGGLGDDGGDGDAWVELKLWRVPLAFPNTEGRRRAVRFHDLHHVLTEYPTTRRCSGRCGYGARVRFERGCGGFGERLLFRVASL